MADTHHDAAENDQRCSRKTELLGAEERRNDDVTASLELTIGLDDHPITQAVEQQCLLCLSEPEFPGAAGVLERGQR